MFAVKASSSPARPESNPLTPAVASQLMSLPLEIRCKMYKFVYDDTDLKVDLDPSMNRTERQNILNLLHVSHATRREIFNFLTVAGHFYDYVSRDERTGLVEDYRRTNNFFRW
ncbi:hypothetical protein NA57DRAFT_54561 [Rhizodiscina lignyota]|uniref:Uncharacterized protein n=1 Tax=Rhizodiscina lignyota TaxID=1504668 RepID=A0A9P4IEU4_9PEZI|nr:hypothetical protein NA57DRAFT_54561 [Rhizodiscina lignyota]